MNQQELEKLLLTLQSYSKECEWVEFKINNSDPQEIGQYISALSNSSKYHKQPYGYLVFGVENNTHNLVGTKFHPHSEKIGEQELENWLATQLSPKIDFNIFEFSYLSMHFAILRIDATKNRPTSFRGEEFIRIGSYKKKLKDHPERERKLWVIDHSQTFECEHAQTDKNEEEVLQLIDYQSFFKLLKFPMPVNKDGIIEKLKQERVISNSLHGFNISNLGAILLARDIEEFPSIARKAIRVVFYDGKSRIKTKKEQVGIKGYAIGFEGLMKYLDENLPSNEIIDLALRKIVPLYPIIAIRELVANALIHQDFSVKGSSPMIEIFDNRIEITNPGIPLIDPLRFVDHSPESRNESLARFMRRLYICEERGSGIDKVVYECEYNQLPAPEIIAGENYTRIILYGLKKFKDMDKQDKIRACYLHSCLKIVSGEYMTNQSLRARFGIEEHNYSTVSRIIGDTKSTKLIRDYDPENKSRTYAKYVPYWF